MINTNSVFACIQIRLNPDCTGALTKMQHCGACKGYTEKPCTNYCVNVIKGCLHYLHEFDTEWENFALAMDKVAERMLGSFNIVMVVEPINIKISEAIMNFQVCVLLHLRNNPKQVIVEYIKNRRIQLRHCQSGRHSYVGIIWLCPAKRLSSKSNHACERSLAMS